jgi:Spy/CpxP family protein refolding chaperone
MKTYKVFIILVSALVVINCVSLYFFWFKKDGHFPGKNGPPPAANIYLSKELNLTAAQQKEYDVMRKQHFEHTQNLNWQSRALRDEFFENVKSPKLDTAATFALERKILAIQMALDTVTLNHFRKFRTLLDVGQQTKFDHIIKNALRMMTGPQHPGGRGRGPNGMPPPRDGMPPPEGGPGPGQGPPPDGSSPPPGN